MKKPPSNNFPQVHDCGKLTVTVIASGSVGNAVFVRENDSTHGIMIDIGVSYKRIEPWVQGVDAVLATHVHLDHWRKNTMDKLKSINPKCLYIEPQGSGIEYAFDSTIPHNTWAVIRGKYSRIMCIPTPHSVNNVAWVVQFLNSGATYFHATDTASLNHISCKGADVYGIECNYSDIEELVNRKNGHEVISVSSHLSTENALAWFELNKGSDSKFIPLHEARTFKN